MRCMLCMNVCLLRSFASWVTDSGFRAFGGKKRTEYSRAISSAGLGSNRGSHRNCIRVASIWKKNVSQFAQVRRKLQLLECCLFTASRGPNPIVNTAYDSFQENDTKHLWQQQTTEKEFRKNGFTMIMSVKKWFQKASLSAILKIWSSLRSPVSVTLSEAPRVQSVDM
jgi:hypothetical protein